MVNYESWATQEFCDKLCISISFQKAVEFKDFRSRDGVAYLLVEQALSYF